MHRTARYAIFGGCFTLAVLMILAGLHGFAVFGGWTLISGLRGIFVGMFLWTCAIGPGVVGLGVLAGFVVGMIGFAVETMCARCRRA